MRTTFPRENGEQSETTKDSTNISGQLENENEQTVKFPKRLRNRGKGKVLATIYRRADCYRLYWRTRVDGKPVSRFKDFGTYSEAKREGDKVVGNLVKGSQASVLSSRQATDALVAFQRLQSFYETTGRRLTLAAGISDYCDVLAKLNGRSLGEAVDGFLSTVATVKRKDVAQAVEEFISADDARTKATDGKRSQLSPKYAYNRAIMLRRFAGAFPNTAVSELAKEHLDAFIGGLAEIKSKSRNGKPVTSAKGRNHHRAAIRQFLTWCVRRDYLAPTHRLGEAVGLQPENGNTSEILFYTPAEFNALLEAAKGPMQAVIALGGLAGLRTSELLRLDWADVWRVPGHIEITASKSKTRQRRLVEVCTTLAQWLEPFHESTAGRVMAMHEITFQQHFVDLCEKARVEIKPKQKVKMIRKPNGLRHAFVTYHFALHGNENATAMQAGNSPAMVHGHYKGLATKAQSEQWFAVAPEHPANVIALTIETQK